MAQRRFVLHSEINVTACKGQVQDTDTKDRVVTAKHVYHSFGDALCRGHHTKGVTDSEKLRNQGAGWSSPNFQTWHPGREVGGKGTRRASAVTLSSNSVVLEEIRIPSRDGANP